MGSVIKKRRKRMSKKKHRKLLRKTRHQRKESSGACEASAQTKSRDSFRSRGIFAICAAVSAGIFHTSRHACLSGSHLLGLSITRGPFGSPTMTWSTMFRNRPCSTTPTVVMRSCASSCG